MSEGPDRPLKVIFPNKATDIPILKGNFPVILFNESMSPFLSVIHYTSQVL